MVVAVALAGPGPVDFGLAGSGFWWCSTLVVIVRPSVSLCEIYVSLSDLECITLWDRCSKFSGWVKCFCTNRQFTLSARVVVNDVP